METKQKTVTIEIPEGKKAVWNEQGILQLVDDKEANKPKDITDYIKTFYDAYSELERWASLGDSEALQLIKEYDSVNTEETSDDLVAYLQLRIITAALNEGWKPQFTKDEERWFPYLDLFDKDLIDTFSDDEKDRYGLSLWGDVSSGAKDCGCTFALVDSSISREEGNCSSRLAYKSKELAEYAGTQFSSVYARFYFGEKAIGALPWREYEQKRKSNDNK